MNRPRKITLAHSPDSDDAFMFYGLSKGKVDARGFEIQHVLEDIESLNLHAQEGFYDVTAVSFHAWPHVRDQYVLTRCGASVGDGYGPVLVSRRPLARQELEDVTIAVAGTLTTSYLALKLYCPGVKTRVMPFDRIQDAVLRGDVDAGLLIHEGQLTFQETKLHRVADLGEWWGQETGLPLPLGGNAVRRSFPADVKRDLAAVVKSTIEYGLAHRAEALEHALSYGRGLDKAKGDRFVGMYVNDYTVDLGPRGEEALKLLYQLGHEAGLIRERVVPEFAA